MQALNIVATMMVWSGCSQHEGAPKVVGSALQISLKDTDAEWISLNRKL